MNRNNFRADIFAAIAEYEHYHGKFNYVDFLVANPHIESHSDLIKTLNQRSIEAAREVNE